jgi:hypothetical protein
MKICLSRWCFMASNGAVCLSNIIHPVKNLTVASGILTA